jgi:hypothetical protein
LESERFARQENQNLFQTGLDGANQADAAQLSVLKTLGAPLQIVLPAEVIADLHQHRDAFGITGLCGACRIGAGAEFPGISASEHGDDHAVRTVGVSL